MKLVELQPNVPQELALGRDTSPLKLSGGCGSLYALSDGRLLHLSGRESDDLAILKLKPGETFGVCLHHQPGELPDRTAWLSPETEKARAAEEAPELERQLAASLEIVNASKRGFDPVLRPTGTEGGPIPVPAPQRKPAIAAVAAGGRKRERGEPIPLNVAFREILAFVCAELAASGEQWSENSRQDLCSTVMIAAQKAGMLGVWEREEAA